MCVREREREREREGEGEGEGGGIYQRPHSEHRFPALSPNSAGFSYATEGALFISAQLSSDAVAPSERFGY